MPATSVPATPRRQPHNASANHDVAVAMIAGCDPVRGRGLHGIRVPVVSLCSTTGYRRSLDGGCGRGRPRSRRWDAPEDGRAPGWEMNPRGFPIELRGLPIDL